MGTYGTGETERKTKASPAQRPPSAGLRLQCWWVNLTEGVNRKPDSGRKSLKVFQVSPSVVELLTPSPSLWTGSQLIWNGEREEGA